MNDDRGESMEPMEEVPLIGLRYLRSLGIGMIQLIDYWWSVCLCVGHSHTYDTIRYNTRSYFNERLKADIS